MRGKQGRHSHLHPDVQTLLHLDLTASSLLMQLRVCSSPSKAQILHLGSESTPLSLSSVIPCHLLFFYQLPSLGSVLKSANMLLYLPRFFPGPLCPLSCCSISQLPITVFSLKRYLGKAFKQAPVWFLPCHVTPSLSPHILTSQPSVIYLVMILDVLVLHYYA